MSGARLTRRQTTKLRTLLDGGISDVDELASRLGAVPTAIIKVAARHRLSLSLNCLDVDGDTAGESAHG